MKHKVLSKIISMALIPVMLLSTASCGKKTYGKTARKISSEEPWFNAKVYNIEPDLEADGKVIEYKQQKLAGIDDKYIVVFSNGDFVHPDNNEEYDSRDYSFYLATIVDRNTGEKIRTIDLNQYLSDQGFVKAVEYHKGTITSRIYNYDGDTQVIAEVDNDVLSGKKLEERDLGENDGSDEGCRFNAGKYVIRAESAFDNSTSDSFYILKITSSEGEEHCVEIKKDRIGLWDIPIILSLDGDKLMVPVKTSTNDLAFFEVDIKAEKAVEVDGKDYDWIDF